MRFAAKSIKFSVTGRILECHSREALKRASLSNSFSLQRRKLNIKGWTGSRQSWDKSTAPLLQHSFHMDTWRAGTTKGEEKRKCITFNHSLCRGFWHLCLCLLALISLPSKEKKFALFIHKRVNCYSPIYDERTSGLALNKIGNEGKVYFEIPPTTHSCVFPPGCPRFVLQLGILPTGLTSRVSSKM